MGRIIESLRDSGAITLDVNLLTGSYEDRSVYKNVVTATGTPTWTAGRQGWGLTFSATSHLSIPAAVGLNGPKTWAFTAEPSPIGNVRIAAARNGVSTDLDIYTYQPVASGLTALVWYNGSSSIAQSSTLLFLGRSIVACADYWVQSNGVTGATAPVSSSGNAVDWWIGSFQANPALFYPTPIRRAMLLNRTLTRVEASLLLEDMESARYPTRVFSTQAYQPVGSIGRVTSNLNLDAAPVTMSNITTVGQEIFEGAPIRQVTGSTNIGSNPKSIGCTAASVVACAAPPGGSKRLSFIWSSSTIECGWCTVRGLATATGQNGYWWRISAGQLQIVKSVAGVETVLATDGTITAGVEYELQFDWSIPDGLLRLWYKPYGAASWTLGCSATDTSVSTTSLMCLSLIGTGNRITRKVTTKDIAIPPDDWDGLTQDWTFSTTKTSLAFTSTGAQTAYSWGDGTNSCSAGAVTKTYSGGGTRALGLKVMLPSALTLFTCYSNQLTGSIPSLSANTALTAFSCSTNQLTGSIPSLSANTALTTFYCHENQLTGSIPSLSANTALTLFSCYSNQLTGSIPSLSANTALTIFTCYSNQLTGSIPSLTANTYLLYFYCYSNQLTGSIPSLTANTALVQFQCHVNQLTGSIPSLTANTALTLFYCHVNNLTGSIPSLSANTALTLFSCYSNQLTGSIPSLTTNTALTLFFCYSNQLTGYTASTLAATLTDFQAQNNLLTQAAVDQILADFATGVAGRPAAGTISLGGTGNAAPSAAGLASKAAILAAKPGWTITHN